MKEVCVVMSCNIRKTEGSLMKGTWHRPVLSIKKDVLMLLCECCGFKSLDRHSLASQKFFCKKGELCIQAISAALYSVIQSCCSTWAHDTLQYFK